MSQALLSINLILIAAHIFQGMNSSIYEDGILAISLLPTAENQDEMLERYCHRGASQNLVSSFVFFFLNKVYVGVRVLEWFKKGFEKDWVCILGFTQIMENQMDRT